MFFAGRWVLLRWYGEIDGQQSLPVSLFFLGIKSDTWDT